jgi:hypothetical protein
VDAGPLAEDVPAHLRVPAARLVAEVNTGLQQLLDSHLSQRVAPLCGVVTVARRTEARGPGHLGRAGPRATRRDRFALPGRKDSHQRNGAAANQPPRPAFGWAGPPEVGEGRAGPRAETRAAGETCRFSPLVHKDERGDSEAASFYVSAPVWPSGDWLPLRHVVCATQIHGWFGLAIDEFPGNRMTKPQQ